MPLPVPQEVRDEQVIPNLTVGQVITMLSRFPRSQYVVGLNGDDEMCICSQIGPDVAGEHNDCLEAGTKFVRMYFWGTMK